MARKKSVFIGGKQIGANCLKILIEMDLKPEVVVGNADDTGIDLSWHESVIKIAQEAGIPTIIGKKVRDSDVIARIQDSKPEIIFTIGGTQIVPPEVLAIPPLGVVNIHPALLPKYRGRYSTVHAIFNGEKYTGVTVHLMNEEIDAGPIVTQEKLKIEDFDTAKTLYDKFTNIGTKLFREFVANWQAGRKITAVPQNEQEATYFPKGLPNNGEIDWSWSGEQINRFIRAMTFEPFPPASWMIGDKKMVVVDEKYFKGFKN